MKVSEKSGSALFSAISDPIMELRISDEGGRVKDMDGELFKLQLEIHRRVCAVLAIVEGSN